MGLNFFNSSSQSLEFFDCFLTILCKFCLMISQNLRRHARHFGMRNYSRHPRKAPLQEYPASVIPPYRLCLALYRSPGLYLRRVWKAQRLCSGVTDMGLYNLSISAQIFFFFFFILTPLLTTFKGKLNKKALPF